MRRHILDPNIDRQQVKAFLSVATRNEIKACDFLKQKFRSIRKIAVKKESTEDISNPGDFF